jgi:hypothetical protein
MMPSLKRNVFASFRASSQQFLLLCTPLLTGCKECGDLDTGRTSTFGREHLIVSGELRECCIEQAPPGTGGVQQHDCPMLRASGTPRECTEQFPNTFQSAGAARQAFVAFEVEPERGRCIARIPERSLRPLAQIATELVAIAALSGARKQGLGVNSGGSVDRAPRRTKAVWKTVRGIRRPNPSVGRRMLRVRAVSRWRRRRSGRRQSNGRGLGHR